MTGDDGYRQQRIAETFAEFASALSTGVAEVALLRLAADRFVELLGVVASGLVLAGGETGLCGVQDGDARAARLRSLLLSPEEGPGHECCRSGVTLSNVDVAANATRWPRFVTDAVRLGLTTVSTMPLQVPELRVGAVVLIDDGANSLSQPILRLGQTLADATANAVVAQRERQRNELRAGQLQEALTSRIVIEQAKGVLAERCQIGVDDAFRLLRDQARRQNRRLADLARDVVDGTGTLWQPGPATRSQTAQP